jgi:hypothetical protein
MWWILYGALRSVMKHIANEEVLRKHSSSVSRYRSVVQLSTTTVENGITHQQPLEMQPYVLATPLLDCGQHSSNVAVLRVWNQWTRRGLGRRGS